MHLSDEITIDRATRALTERVLPAVHGPSVALAITRFELPGEPIAPAEALGAVAEFSPFEVGALWGRAWGTTWFRFEGTIPADWAGARVEALIDLGFDRRMTGFQCEGLAFTPDGRAIKSLNPQNQWLGLGQVADSDGRVEFFVEAASNPVILDFPAFQITAEGDRLTSSDRELYRFARADLTLFNEPVFELAMDLDVLIGLQAQLPKGPRRSRILQALDDALDLLDVQDVVTTAQAARDILRPILDAPAEHSAHRVPRSATRTSTRRGCGRSARRCARPRARCRRSST